jgi:hypothetical protein
MSAPTDDSFTILFLHMHDRTMYMPVACALSLCLMQHGVAVLLISIHTKGSGTGQMQPTAQILELVLDFGLLQHSAIVLRAPMGAMTHPCPIRQAHGLESVAVLESERASSVGERWCRGVGVFVFKARAVA